MRRNKQEPPELIEEQNPSDFINSLTLRHIENPFRIVANQKPKENPLLRANLIELTERLAKCAKDGSLKGLGGFADYGDSYMLGLEGSYLEEPTAAVLPMKLLEKRVMDQIEQLD